MIFFYLNLHVIEDILEKMHLINVYYIINLTMVYE